MKPLSNVHFRAPGGRPYLDVQKLRSVIALSENSARAKKMARRKLAILEHNLCRCGVCGSEEYLTIDHLVSLAKLVRTAHPTLNAKEAHVVANLWRSEGRAYEIENCQVLCAKCHDEKDGPSSGPSTREVANDDE